ncbi:DUF6495 family protein [Gilvibacter sediminis]|uniref:DUF6495 family protein n=1 Tax=Gilvibacter sediminis TaxID=379071 RepID=UPI00234FF902|nr:DUF6495 family protein [Gilvibacter sediminis]MDC7998169.1 DUF6495 family protein [Gilvibacter sediminis]
MKYTRLTKEQFEELQEEFTRFLATQSITADEWQQLKTQQPEVAEAELDVFSDLVWEGALNAAKYLENASADQVFCIAIESEQMRMIHARIPSGVADLTQLEGRQWLLDHIQDDGVQLQTGTKTLGEERNQQIFGLIQQGAVIANKDLFEALNSLIK